KFHATCPSGARPFGRAFSRPSWPSALTALTPFDLEDTMFHKLHSLIVTLVLLFSARQATAKLEVVATTPDLAAVARDVGGPDAHVVAMALATQDPHFVDAKPHLAL